MRFKQFAPGPTPLADARTTALPSCSRTRVLGVPDTDPAAWLTTTTFYDERARPCRCSHQRPRGPGPGDDSTGFLGQGGKKRGR